MDTIELKNNFHNLIDSIDNENLLINFYSLIKKRTSANPGHLWNKLKKQEQNDLFETLEDCKNIENTISHEKMKKKHEKWL